MTGRIDKDIWSTLMVTWWHDRLFPADTMRNFSTRLFLVVELLRYYVFYSDEDGKNSSSFWTPSALRNPVEVEDAGDEPEISLHNGERSRSNRRLRRGRNSKRTQFIAKYFIVIIVTLLPVPVNCTTSSAVSRVSVSVKNIVAAVNGSASFTVCGIPRNHAVWVFDMNAR